MGERVPHEMDAAALPGGAEDFEIAAFRPLVGIGDHQLHPPRRPRRASLRRKAVQNGSASGGPMSMPSTSRRPSLLTPTARPLWPARGEARHLRRPRGLKAAIAKILSATWQRCRVHFMRNALAHAGRSGRRVVSAFIATAFAQDDANSARQQWRLSPTSSAPRSEARRADGRGRARRAGLHELPDPASCKAPLHQTARAPQRRDQAPHRGRRHLPQRGRHHPTRRRHPARTERRVWTTPTLQGLVRR